MYIYHALINALSAHMIHINLNMIFYTHVEHSPTETVYIKYYMEKQTHTLQTHTHTCWQNLVNTGECEKRLARQELRPHLCLIDEGRGWESKSAKYNF